MKLAITTQHMENYGAHNWDGKGECPQHWKGKGGAVYVVAGLVPKNITTIAGIWRTMVRPLIESDDEGSREYIIDWGLHDDCEAVCADWEDPWYITASEAGKLTATRTRKRYDGKAGSVVETYTMKPHGEREDYTYEEVAAAA